MAKKVISILLILTMTFSVFILTSVFSAGAAEQYYLWVNGEQFTSDHLTVKGTSIDGKDGGTAVFDPNTSTLTLNNVTLTECYGSFGDYASILNNLPKLTIIVKGKCRIIPEDAYGIMSLGYNVFYDCDLTIKSDGKPESELIIAPNLDEKLDGIQCWGKMTVDGVPITITSLSDCIYVEAQVTIQNKAKVVCKSENSSGIYSCGGSIAVKNSDLSVEGNTIAIQLLDDRYTEGKGSTLTIDGGSVSAKARLGIYGGLEGNAQINIKKGTLEITGTGMAMPGEGTVLVRINESDFTFGDKVKVVEGGYKENYLKISDETSAPSPSVLIGDADQDKKVTIADVTCIQQYLAKFKMTKFDKKAADTDGDGTITITDASVVQQFLANIIKSLPAAR